MTARGAVVCEECSMTDEDCNPGLWAQQKKCCPDCTHIAAEAESLRADFAAQQEEFRRAEEAERLAGLR